MTNIFHKIHNQVVTSKTDQKSSGSSTFSSSAIVVGKQQQQQCRLLATSASSASSIPPTTRYETTRNQQQILALKGIDGHSLCQYQKGFFDHLKLKPLVTSTLRVATQQGAQILANFMTDQMEQDMKRNELVDEGKMSQGTADEEAAEWEKREWAKRWQVYPSRFFTALAKYHVVTLVMRSYEAIADKLYDKVTMDKLTMDPFQKAKDITASLPKEKNQSQNREIAKEMFYTTFWSNLIAFLADYSVHQVILCYVYITYIRRQRQKKEQNEKDNKKTTGDAAAADDDAGGAVLASFLKKSTQLGISRSVGLVCSAAGGAVGTLILPGWGTLLASNLGDGFAGVIVDDGQGGSPAGGAKAQED